jgi:hypothetical protein
VEGRRSRGNRERKSRGGGRRGRKRGDQREKELEENRRVMRKGGRKGEGEGRGRVENGIYCCGLSCHEKSFVPGGSYFG